LGSSAPAGAALGPLTETRITLLDNDTPGRFAFAAAEFTVREDGTSAARVAITRDQGTSGSVPLKIHLVALPGEALPGADFPAAALDVVVPEGSLHRFVEIPLLDDTLHERREQLRLRLELAVSAPAGSSLGSLTEAVLFIEDNDPSRPPRINLPAYPVNGRFGLEAWGDADQLYRIEQSTDLTHWTLAAEIRSDAAGHLRFETAHDPHTNSCFLRLAAP
jgi:hypothetical protein